MKLVRKFEFNGEVYWNVELSISKFSDKFTFSINGESIKINNSLHDEIHKRVYMSNILFGFFNISYNKLSKFPKAIIEDYYNVDGVKEVYINLLKDFYNEYKNNHFQSSEDVGNDLINSGSNTVKLLELKLDSLNKNSKQYKQVKHCLLCLDKLLFELKNF